MLLVFWLTCSAGINQKKNLDLYAPIFSSRQPFCNELFQPVLQVRFYPTQVLSVIFFSSPQGFTPLNELGGFFCPGLPGICLVLLPALVAHVPSQSLEYRGVSALLLIICGKDLFSLASDWTHVLTSGCHYLLHTVSPLPPVPPYHVSS